MQMKRICDDLYIDMRIHNAETGNAGLPMMDAAHGVEDMRYAFRAGIEAVFRLTVCGVRMTHIDNDACIGY